MKASPLRSLKTRVTVFTLVIFLACIWSLWLYASQMLRQDMQQMLGEQQLSSVSLVAADINQEFTDRLQALQTVAASISPGLLRDGPALQTLLGQQAVFQGLFNAGTFATDIQGTAVASLPVAIGRVGVNYLDRDHVATALREGKATISQPVIGKKLNSPVISLATPIRDASGEVIGALVGVINLSAPNFLDRLSLNRPGRGGQYLLVAPLDRVIVTGSNKSRILEAIPAPGRNPALDNFMLGHEGSEVFTNSHGVPVLVSARRVAAANWIMAAALPTAEAFAPIQALQQRMLLATALLTLLAGALTWWMLKRELSPMLSTVQQLADMSGQDRPLHALPIKRKDEVGQLIGGFNQLMATIGLREAALQERDAFSHAILNSMTAEIAVLDRDGVIVAVNLPWQRFALENAGTPGQASPRTGIGANYLTICQNGMGLPSDGAMDAHDGIRAVLEGRLPNYRLEYPCDSPTQQRWFGMSVTPLGSTAGGVVVAHTDITQRKAAEHRVQSLTHLYAASSHCSQAIVRCTSETELFAKICQDMVRFGHMKMAWIGWVDETSQRLLPVASWGDARGYLDDIHISVDAADPFGQGPAAIAVRDQRPFWCQDFCHDPLTAPWHERGAMAGWGASAGLPLLRNGRVVGVFSLYAADPNAFDEDTRQLLSDMATDISFALDGYEREAARRAAEAALASTSDLLQRTGEMARIGGWELDLVKLHLHWSAETCRIHEIDGLVAPPLDQAIHFYAPEARAIVQAAVQAGIDHGTPWDLELPLITARQRQIWVRAQGTTHMLNGQAVKLVGAFQDITERKLVEVALREAEAHNRALISAIPDLIFTNRSDGEYLSVQASDPSLLLVPPDVFMNRKVVEVLPQPVAGQLMQAFADALASGSMRVLNYPLLMEGQERHYEARIVPSADDTLITIVRDVTERRHSEASQQRYTLQLQALSRRVLEVQEAERRRLAIELHDELGQLLTAIKINLQSSARFKDRDPTEHNAENILIVEDALQQVRRLALALRPSMLDDLGLAPALRWMAEQSAARSGFAVDFYTARLSDRLAPDIEIACFRIAQEALTNVARYAQAKQVGIQMRQDGDELVLSVQDDGCGFDVAAMRAGALAGGSIGVLGMQERAALIGGRLDIESVTGQGTTVRLTCPLRLRADAT